jgi:hypothetical protein
MTLLPPKPGS